MSSTPKQFTGTSESGDFAEAIDLAVAAAKDGLSTDFIKWTLVSVTGEYGGFTLQRHLTVTISATGPSGAA